MSGRYLLDTNVLVDFYKGDSQIAQNLKREVIFIISIVAGELYYGAYASGIIKNRDKRLEQITLLLLSYSVLDIDDGTAGYYGEIKSQLKESGTPIPENDIWIAAHCKQYELKLVTRDKHFLNIEDLESVTW